MRRRVFDDPVARRDLEAITHPRIRAELHRRCASAPGPYVIASIPLLAETGAAEAYRWLRRVLVIDCAESLQLARLLRRDGIGLELATRMISAQASRRSRLALATDVIVNDDGEAAMQGAVARLDRIFRGLAV